jgi:hypothetical protein
MTIDTIRRTLEPQWLAQRHGVDAGWTGRYTLWPMSSPRSRGR